MYETLCLTFGWVLTIASLAGWIAAIAHYGKIRAELSAPLSACAVIIIVYICGLCGSLLVGAWIAALAGLALFLLITARHRHVWREFASPGFAFLAVFAVFVALQVHDDALSHNDDFNHWAVIIRNMLLRDRFPDSTVTAIDYPSYPPGTAVFDYFINRMTFGSYSEGRLIFSQNLMVLLFLTPIFSVMRKERNEDRTGRYALYAMLCACALLIFLYEFRALIVDVVNGVVGLAAVIGVLRLKDEPKKAILYAAPISFVGLLVKYSNIYYFVATNLALLWVCMRAHKRGEKSRIGLLLLADAACALLIVTWFIHVRAAFGVVSGKHSMNFNRILDVLHSWSQEDITTIARVCLYNATSLKKSSFLLTLFMNVAALCLAAYNRIAFQRSPKRLICAVALADLCYIGYQLMLFCAYVLSFPRDEALRGASYGRYNMSVMIWVIGFLSAFIVEELCALGAGKGARAWRTIYGFGFTLVTIAALAITGEGATLFHEVPYEGTCQASSDAIIAEHTFTDDDSFFILAADEDARQVASVFHYKVNRHVDFAHVDDVQSPEDLLALCAESDYLIVLEDDERIAELLEGLAASESPIGAYPISDVAAWVSD